MFQDNEQDENRAYSFSGESSGTGEPSTDPTDGSTNAPQQGDPPADPDSSAPSGGTPTGDSTTDQDR